MVHRFFPTLAALWLALGPAAALEPARPQAAATGLDARLAGLVERDRRVSFTSESTARARAVLDAEPKDLATRAAAALVLGEGRTHADLARLEALVAEGKPMELSAALFALGNMGSEGTGALERARERGVDGPPAAALAVAWLLAGARGVAVRPPLEGLAEGDSELGRFARQALDYEGGGGAGPLAPTFVLYYELRWRAARSYGLVDGQRWQKVLLGELLQNDEFLDGVILGTLQDLPTLATSTHLGELLLQEERPDVLRAALAIMPAELARAASSGPWVPLPATWHTLVEETDELRCERRVLPLLERARVAAPELAPEVDFLSFRGGAPVPWSTVAARLAQGGAAERVRLVAACGDRGEKQVLPALSELLDKQSDPLLVGAGLVARARLGLESAESAIETLVAGPQSEVRDGLLHALADAFHDRDLWRHGKEALRRDDLTPELRREVVLALARAGEPDARALLRGGLAGEMDADARLQAVRALGPKCTPSELAVLRPLFPAGQELALDIELGRALIVGRDPLGETILDAALWRDRWSQSVLAGGLIVHCFGARALLDQLEAAPRGAHEEDHRRVGFAIGEWGGLTAVEELRRARQEGDPALQGALLGALSARTAEIPAFQRPTNAVIKVRPK